MESRGKKQALEVVARQVVLRYPELTTPETWEMVRPGFSGAIIWKVNTSAGSFALRAWPPHQSIPNRLSYVHGLMEKAGQHLPFVPRLVRQANGSSWTHQYDRCWEVTTWMPGRASFADQPSLPRLFSAIDALADLHVQWRGVIPVRGISVGLERRKQALALWPDLQLRLRENNLGAVDEVVDNLIKRSVTQLQYRVLHAQRLLDPWIGQSFSLQPCLADPWHDHFLFLGERVSGLIDYGSVREDHVSVDLARMLGSLVPRDKPWRMLALETYCERGSLRPEEWSLVDALDRSGTLVGVMNWLRWLVFGERPIVDLKAGLHRWSVLVQVLEQMD